jgi:predicted O-methyltransferase YrrM
MGHLARKGENFYDQYMLAWEIGCAKHPARILEIGTRTGLSLCQLLSAFVDQSKIQKVVCIDPFADPYTSAELVKKNLRSLNLPVEKVEFLVGFSQDFLPKMIYLDKDRFDYILVDGDHSKKAAREDLEAVHNLIADGGVIVFDDVSDAPGECALIDVWQQFKAEHEAEYEWHLNMSGKGVAWAIRKQSTP